MLEELERQKANKLFFSGKEIFDRAEGGGMNVKIMRKG